MKIKMSNKLYFNDGFFESRYLNTYPQISIPFNSVGRKVYKLLSFPGLLLSKKLEFGIKPSIPI